MDCPRCQIENLPQANFCFHCGQPLTRRGSKPVDHVDVLLDRPQAYTPRHLRDKILAARGTLEGERKQVTVLFCDIVRSSALVSHLGAERFHDLMSEFFTLALNAVHHFEGTINQFLGDGFMALFGAPIAHEDHTRRAILAALGLRTAVADTLGQRAVEIRQGIGTGLVVVGKIGDDLRMDYTAFGDTTVLAARLQAAAAPGEILLSDDAAERMRGYFAFGNVNVVTVKERTVKSRSVLGVGLRRSRLEDSERTLAPFVGRDPDLQFLRDALGQTRQGKGQVVGIVGDPGVGKSRLVLELGERLAQETAYEGRCASYGAAIPYLPIVDLLRQTCGIDSADSPAVVSNKLHAVLLRLGLDAEGSLPFLLYLLGQGVGTDALLELDPATVKGRTFEILRELWLAESRRQPLVLVIEDLHWIDRTSEAFLAALGNDAAEAPLLLVTTYRPGYIAPWAGRSWACELALGPLSMEASREIVIATLSRTIDAIVANDIVSRADGNPFFLEELAQATRYHDGALDRDVPQTVQEVLAARIDRLGDEPKHALQTASVLGREFSLVLLEEVWDGRPRVDAELQELKRLEFVFERARADALTFTFKHALTQEVAYASLLEKRRRELHGRAGHALERLHADHLDEQYELLAYHYARSDDRENAAHYLMLANRKAAQQNAMQEAVGYFYEALRVLESLPDSDENRRRRLRLVFDQTGEFHFLHRHQEYYDLILRHQALALEVNDRELLGAFYARLGHRQWTSGRSAESIPTLEQAVELSEGCGNLHDAAGAYAILGWAHLMVGNYDRVPFYRDKALEKLRESFHPVWYSFARAAAVVSYTWSGRWDEAVREGEMAMAEGRARSDSAIVAFNAFWVTHAYIHKQDWQRAQEYGELSLREAPTIYFQGFPQACLARIACETDRAAEAVAVLSQIEPLFEASGHRPGWGIMPLFLGQACLAVGDRERAAAMIEKVNAAPSTPPRSFYMLQSNRLLGEIALARGDLHDAASLIGRAVELARATGSEDELGLALAASGRLSHALGDTQEAHQNFAEALDILERLGKLQEPGRIRRELLNLDSA